MPGIFPSRKQIERELAILNTPTYQEAHEGLAAYIRRLQEATTATELRLLQRDLVLDTNARQKALAEFVAERRPPAKARIDELKSREPKPKLELAAAQRILRGADHAEAVARALQHATRVLADGMVWRAFEFDRTTISILGKEEPVAHHADDKGFAAELAALDLVEERFGLLTFHNDTTNVLRRGDITAISLEDGSPFPHPIEVKAGMGRGSKQVARIKESIEMIRARRFIVQTEFRTHIGELAELIATAKHCGYANRRLDCHFVHVDYRHWGDHEEHVELLAGRALRELAWSGGDRLVLVGMSSVSRIRDRGNPVVELAPTSIFPLAAEDIADLLLGFVDVSVHLNTELLGLRFNEHGMRASFTLTPTSATHFLEARRGFRGFLMPAYVREQMLHELMTVETLVELSDWILRSGKTREWVDIEKAPIVGFANERTVWSPGSHIDLAA
ncbi:MAG: hypothetical protein QOF45_2037 [Gaiellaceae bacterium]|jgi:hypothetical protein|nr:hypothetical protein [Gaiellaceae bacterium]